MADRPGQLRNPASSASIQPAILALFIGSGCSALIYEIVWFQMLELVIGASAISLGVLLGTFMGGMCLGSLLAPWAIRPTAHPLRVYSLLELGVGVIGLLVLFAVPYIDHAYVAALGQGWGNMWLRAIICAICLLPPAMLMGATLPAVARWVEATPRGVSWLGLFYAGNIAGAVFGCLLAGFYLLRIHDVEVATYVAVAMNFAVAAVAWIISQRQPQPPRANTRMPAAETGPSSAWAIYPAIAISGCSALGAEVVWTRLLALMFGATVYTFSIILAVFLIGLGIGSSVGAMLCRRLNPRLVLAGCQLLLAGAITWTAISIARWLPFWSTPQALSGSVWGNLLFDMLRCAASILPAALLWGASFPAAIAAVSSRGGDTGRLVGRVYAANTVGGIIGALHFAILVIPKLKSDGAQRILIMLAVVGASVATLPSLWPRGVNGRRQSRFGISIPRLAALLLAAVALPPALARLVPQVPWELIAYGRYLSSNVGISNLLYVEEGINSSVAVSEANGELSFHVSGKTEASSGMVDMRLQRMLGHIPALVHPHPRSVLVVGCGAGVTAGSFIVYPSVQRIVICEIEPLIPKKIANQFFPMENYFVVEDPRTQIVYDDARHYVLTTPEKFDIITSDPIHPWVKGAATLYTREYFELVKHHLNPGGVVTQWVPLYESSVEAVKSEIRTFFEVFPHGTIWSNDAAGKGYDILLLGQAHPTQIIVDALQERIEREDHAGAAESLREVGFESLLQLLATYAGRGRDLEPWLRDAQINRDRNLRLQYLAGIGLNNFRSEQIQDQIMAYNTYPEELFIASSESRQALKAEIFKATLRRTAK